MDKNTDKYCIFKYTEKNRSKELAQNKKRKIQDKRLRKFAHLDEKTIKYLIENISPYIGLRL